MLTGIFSTLLLPETNGLSLEILSNETQERFPMGRNYPAIKLQMYTKLCSLPGDLSHVELPEGDADSQASAPPEQA
jgi:hypothetical protein